MCRRPNPQEANLKSFGIIAHNSAWGSAVLLTVVLFVIRFAVYSIACGFKPLASAQMLINVFS